MRKYTVDHITGTSFDSDSIMLLPIPKSFTAKGVETHWNADLSPLDKQLVAGDNFYPNAKSAASPSGVAPKK